MKVFLLIFFILLFNQSTRSQTQYPPISPKWVFEPWVWEDSLNTETSTLNLKNGYLNRDIPVGAVIIDSPWEWPNDSKGDRGYNTFIFDSSRYNHPYNLKNFINDSLYSNNIHVILWITGNMTTNSPEYQYAYSKGYFIKNTNGDVAVTYFWRGNNNASHIDFFNPKAVSYWDSLMDRVFNNYEVDGWKVDESDANVPDQISTYAGMKTHSQYSSAYYSAIYNYTRIRRGNNGIIMARPYCKQVGDNPYIFAPISVNTAGWVGDQEHSWNGLQLALNNIFISASLGYSTLGSDIGGYLANNMKPNANLFIRWAELGALCPLMENGGKDDHQHKPWLFNSNTVSIYKYFAKLHHELVPYLYSCNINANLTGNSIMRPFGSRSSSDTNSWSGDWKYLLGDNLFIAAIYQDATDRTITFPTGSSWIDYWDDDSVYQGGSTQTINYPLDHFPVFIKSGAIIPLNVDNNVTDHGTASSKNYLTLLVYPNGTSSYKYYTSSSSSNTVKCNQSCGKYIITFSKKIGSVIIRLKTNIEPEAVYVNGKQALTNITSYNNFGSAQSGWFYGKVASSQNNYAWIKFTNSTDTVSVTTSSVSNIAPTNYLLSKLNINNNYYVDRTYKLLTIPDKYKNLYMIETANDDKTNNSLSFHFDLCGNADIYIAYDHRLAATTPVWITNNYTKTGETISANDDTPDDIIFDIWKRSNVPAGTITFGSNNGVQQSSMYFVFYKSNDAMLPVELNMFEAAVKDNNVVVLNWKTATEVNNYGFEIQRLEVGGQHSADFSWQKIGFVKGAGNSNSPQSYSYTDNDVIGGTKFKYRLKQIDNDGSYEYSKEIDISLASTKYELYQNYPDPFNPTTKIKFNLPHASKVTLTIDNILGQEVASLIKNQNLAAGYHTVTFDGKSLASGTYIYKLQADNFTQVKKMILLK